jgi:aspartate kinase
LRAAQIAASNYGPESDFQTIVGEIKDDHLQAANDINSSLLRKHFEGVVHAECQSLSKILESVREIEEISPKTENKVISKGEKLACQYLAALLGDRGISAQYIDLSEVVKQYNIPTVDISEHHLFAALAKAFSQEILACGDKVPIITGYFGNLASGLLNTVGRGYCSYLLILWYS